MSSDRAEGASRAVLSDLVRTVQLPDQQRRIVTLVAKGYSTRQIAERLGISEYTVANHRAAVLRRLGLRSAVGLCHFAIVAGYVEPGDVPGESED